MGGDVHRGELRAAGSADPVITQDLGYYCDQPEDAGQDGAGGSVDEKSERPDHHRGLCRTIRKDQHGGLSELSCVNQHQPRDIESAAHPVIGWRALAVLCRRINQR